MEKRIKLFTHSDLDGVACGILAKLAFEDNLDITYCDYNNINKKVKAFILDEDYKNYSFVYITDISIDEEVAELIENTQPSTFKDGFHLNEMFQLLDHHSTALGLNKYWWCLVKVDDEKLEELTCGTKMFYDHLTQEEDLKSTPVIENFVEKVRRYDTWLWHTKYNDQDSLQLNRLLYILGRYRFIESMIFKLKKKKVCLFDRLDDKLLSIEDEKLENYVKKKNIELISYKILDHDVGVVFAEQFVSELGNRLSELHPELKFIVIIDPSKSVSYRTTKDDINLGQDVASKFGGGGHPQAAGSQISKEQRDQIFNILFQGDI